MIKIYLHIYHHLTLTFCSLIIPASKSYDAFSSINFPNVAVIRDGRILFYIDDRERVTGQVRFYHKLNERILLLKLVPGTDGTVLNRLFSYYDGVVIESFGVGGFPEYGEVPFYQEIRRWTDAGKLVLMATQVTHEGSDMEVYRVGKRMKEEFRLMEAYDMTLEAAVTKAMWVLGQAAGPEEYRRLFYRTVNHDILMGEV